MNRVARTLLIAGALSGMLAVLLGAFGAHSLGARLSPERLSTWQTGNLYHFLHTLALLISGLASRHMGPRLFLAIAWCFGLGMVLFSGSLYVLALTGISGLGMVAPIGGLLLMAGWALLATGLYRGA